MREELAAFQAAKLISEEPVRDGLRLVVREWKDRDRDFVKLLASRTAAAALRTAVVFSAKDSDPVRVFLARSPDLDFQCGAMLRELLISFGLRGGGSPDLAQGDAPGERMQELLASVIATIRNLLPPQAG